MSLMMILMTALLTSYIFVARGDKSLQNYGDMNSQARLMLEKLGEDLRAATDVVNFTNASLTLTVPTNAAATSTTDVSWDYDAVGGTVTRSITGGSTVYARNVETFSFYYANGTNTQTTSLVEVKQVQISLRMLRLVAGAITSEYVISAQFTMRAKSTTH